MIGRKKIENRIMGDHLILRIERSDHHVRLRHRRRERQDSRSARVTAPRRWPPLSPSLRTFLCGWAKRGYSVHAPSNVSAVNRYRNASAPAVRVHDTRQPTTFDRHLYLLHFPHLLYILLRDEETQSDQEFEPSAKMTDTFGNSTRGVKQRLIDQSG